MATTVEVVRGRVEGDLAERIMAFWSEHGALAGDAARERLRQLVCVVRDGDGGIVGVNSVFEERIDLIGARFWVYRRFVAGELPEGMEGELLATTFDALERERADDPNGPAGLCVLLADAEQMRRHPEAVWPDSEMLYAGYLPDGRQVRIRYFDRAMVS